MRTAAPTRNCEKRGEAFSAAFLALRISVRSRGLSSDSVKSDHFCPPARMVRIDERLPIGRRKKWERHTGVATSKMAIAEASVRVRFAALSICDHVLLVTK